MSSGAARLSQLLSGEPSAQGIYLGRVLEGGNGALRISCAGLTLEPEDLWLPPEYSYQWEEDTGEVYLLRKGDTVLLLSIDGQDFYLMGKAVKA